MIANTPFPAFEFDDVILAQGTENSRRLDIRCHEKFPPNAEKILRHFTMVEVALFLSVNANNLKRLSLEGKGIPPRPDQEGGVFILPNRS